MSHTSGVPTEPLLFRPDMEKLEENEADTDAKLEETLKNIREKTFADSGEPLRSVHAKSHGILKATLTVAKGLPAVLAQGLFAKPGSYPVVMRFSTLPGDVLSDDVSTPRGLAFKVIGVEGERLPGSEGDVTQDFVMVNAPAFSAPTAKKFLGSLKQVAATTDRIEGLKEVISHVARGTEALLEAFGHKSPLVVTLGGQPATNILGETFYTQTPFLFGPYIAKFSLKPVSVGLTGHTGKKLDVHERPHALREAVIHHFDKEGGEWELQVQLATDLDAMPVEDSSVPWPEGTSPYITVARLSAAVQNAWSDENRRAVDDGLSFSPWHGLAAHRPLGGVNRARNGTYRNSAAFRGSHTGCPMHEPRLDVAAG